MITCPACGKQNQDHYRFCLGCGAELPRGAPAEAEAEGIVDEQTSLGGTASEPPPEPDLGDAPLPPGKCPECEYVNPPTNRFCASCGFRLDEAPKKTPAPAEEDVGAVLVALDPEGNEVGRFSIGSGETTVGRETGDLFGSDSFLSPQHATFSFDGKRLRVRDAGSLNGVFRKLLAEQRAPLKSGQRFRIGQELLEFELLEPAEPDEAGVAPMGSNIDGYVGRITLVVGRDPATRPAYPVPDRGVNLGRERGDVLFSEDGYVSGLHCHVSFENGEAWVTDLGSSNGTFVQLTEETDLENGDVLLMGQQLFRVTI